jgi:hypothetical protein
MLVPATLYTSRLPFPPQVSLLEPEHATLQEDEGSTEGETNELPQKHLEKGQSERDSKARYLL